MDNSILLIFPPSWALNIGGPYISLPLLQGYLSSRNIPCEIIDANLESTKSYGITIDETKVRSAFSEFSLESFNVPWYNAENAMQRIAMEYDGTWSIQNGFVFNNCDLSSSNNLKEYSKKNSPFTKYYEETLIPLIKKDNYPIIGLSAVIPSQLLSSFEIARLLRKEGYNGIIVLGGNTPTRLKNEILLDWVFDIFDVIAFNQGEETLEKLWQARIHHNSFKDVPNISYKEDGTIKTNEVKVLNPDNFSNPSFIGYPIHEYWGINTLTTIGSRGCYHGKCTFCAIPYSWGNEGFIGHGNPENIVSFMIENINKYSINRFSFVDEALHPSILKKLVTEINSRDIKIEFEGYARFDNFWNDQSFLKNLARAGLRKVFLGLEIINGDHKNMFNKKDSSKSAEDMLKLFADNGIKTHLFCMNGFPGTTIDDSIRTIDFLFKNEQLIDTVDISPFVLAKHTKVDLVDPIIIKEKDWALDYDYAVLKKGVLTKKEVELLNTKLENIVWNEKPEWLHPVYRLLSPWYSK